MPEIDRKIVVAVIISAAFIVCTLLVTNAFRNRNRTNDIISVTGGTKQDFVSDLIDWSVDFTRRDKNLQTAFAAIRKDAAQVNAFLVSKGIPAKEIVAGAVDIQREYETEYDAKGNRKESFRGFKLTQMFRIESSDVDKVEAVSREVSSLIDAGIEIHSSTPNFYYTKLGELRIAMIAEATKDGTTRADKIAANAGGRRGNLRYSNLGVFQITGQNTNTDYSWGGAFDTQSKRKTASITVKLQFAID